jgi:SAM-dependent methyltransferase
VDPPHEHEEEAALYAEALILAATVPPRSLLELGAGAGHNALFLKHHFNCTLTDISAPMLDLARQLNPECEVLPGDMRTLRLGRTFDLVLVHDAVMYMTSEQDLRAMAETAFQHTRPGGAALFAPDCVRETFRERSETLEGEEGGRALRGLEWDWDPDPTDTVYTVEYAFLLREGQQVRAVHESHIEGVFPMQTWVDVLGSTGYQVELMPRLLEGEEYPSFLCRRPAP